MHNMAYISILHDVMFSRFKHNNASRRTFFVTNCRKELIPGEADRSEGDRAILLNVPRSLRAQNIAKAPRQTIRFAHTGRVEPAM